METLGRVKSAGQFDIPIDAMYKLATRQNDVFGVEGYEVPQQYVDANRQIKERQYLTQKKGQKAKFPPTKKGSFLDDYTQMFQAVPSPATYDVSPQYFTQAQLDAGQKKPHNTQRFTYIEEIFDQAQKKQFPGVGLYNLEQTDEQRQEELEKLQGKEPQDQQKLRKGNFLNEFQYLGSTSPGPGNYNDRIPLPKIHENKTKPAEWIEKHKQSDAKLAKSPFPDTGTYTPMPVSFETFDHLRSFSVQDIQVKGFGSEERFNQKVLSQSKLSVPSPAHYNLIPNWPGQVEGLNKEQQSQNWMDTVTQGVTGSIYYEKTGI